MSRQSRLARITTHAATRRSVLAGSLAAVAGATIGTRALAQIPAATPGSGTPAAGGADAPVLVVCDGEASRIAVYSIPDAALLGEFDGVGFGTHAGTFQLPDGRMIFADIVAGEIAALRMGADGTPEISDRVPAAVEGGIAWMAASPDLSIIAVGSLLEDSPTQTLNLLDVATFTNTQLEFEMAEPEEIHAWLLGDPLHVHVSVGGRIDSYAYEALLAGDMTPLAEVPVELGSHGGATDVTNDRIFYTTAPGTGFEVLDVSSGAAEYVAQIPWDVDGYAGGRNARPRVLADGRHIVGLLIPGLDDPTTWADAEATLHLTDMQELTAQRLPIATGTFAYRYGTSDEVMLWAGYDADGGHAYVIDVDSVSETFGTVLRMLDIPVPSRAATPGEEIADPSTYVTAVSPDGAYGFIAVAGDSLLKVYDLADGTELTETELPMPLTGYSGYMTVLSTGVTPVDLWAR
ncbi:MAG TPA: hypothetical protein VGT61_11920 [Thermomicrobiales bacterium]|jgi:hypothetical protein|nr:hypothetical protein [Thermomicrobiales bacterium]